MYATFNSLRVNDIEKDFYGVKPLSPGVCPDFSETEKELLRGFVPNAAAEAGEETVLDEPKAKCYAICLEMINNWIETPKDERPPVPEASSDAERLALKHMQVTRIIRTEATREDATILDINWKHRKRNALFDLAKEMEVMAATNSSSGNGEFFVWPDTVSYGRQQDALLTTQSRQHSRRLIIQSAECWQRPSINRS